MKPIKHILLCMLLIKSITLSSQTSCDSMQVCDCIWHDLSPAGIMFGHEHANGSWKISYHYMSMIMKDKLSGNIKVDDNYVFNSYIMSPQSMQMDMHMLMAMYGITDKLSVMAMFNYNVNNMSMTAFPGTTMIMDGKPMVMSTYTNMTTKTSGLGDTKIYAVYALINKNANHVFISGGINIPTGSITIKGKSDDMMYPDTRLPYMMQLGSGSLDFMPGVSYLFKEEKFSAGTQLTLIARPFNNSLGYHLGNELNANAWAAYKWLPWISTSIRVEENSAAKISGNDVSLIETLEPVAFATNYGGNTISAFAGLNFYFNKTWLQHCKLSLEYGQPIYQKVNGVQLAQKSTLYAGYAILF